VWPAVVRHVFKAHVDVRWRRVRLHMFVSELFVLLVKVG
jgi:hypothetical protein